MKRPAQETPPPPAAAPPTQARDTAATRQKTDAAREAFTSFLESRRLRVTRQRMTIFDTAFNTIGHYTAEALYTEARRRDKSVSRATVYRTLPILVGNGLVRDVDIGTDTRYYMSMRDKNTFQAQIICPDCDAIKEADAPFMEWYGKSLAAKFNVELVSQRLQIIARCPECAIRRTEKKD
jgi:Fur family ferric uptake transcriptional regulator